MSAQLTRPAPDRPRLDVAALIPADRAQLHLRLEQRFDAMLARGFIDEVRALKQRGDLTPDLPSMRCVGYRQAGPISMARGPTPSFALRRSRRPANSQSGSSPGCVRWLRISASKPEAAMRFSAC